MIAERDAEARELRTQVEELEESHRDAHAKFEAALEHQEHQLELKDDEIEGANLEIQRLGQRVWDLEDEGERLKEETERTREEAVVDREALENVITALKEVRSICLLPRCLLILFSRNWFPQKNNCRKYNLFMNNVGKKFSHIGSAKKSLLDMRKIWRRRFRRSARGESSLRRISILWHAIGKITHVAISV